MTEVSQGERALLEQIRQGDPQGWAQLIQRYQGRLLAFAQSKLNKHAAAEDAVHAAIVSLLRRGKLPAEIRPYVFRSVRNAVMDGARAARGAAAALLDPGRLGPNQGASNQSMRGVLLRLGPPEGPALTLTWLALVLLVGVAGFSLAARLDRMGEQVAVVGTVGLLAVLVSPVSWVHHLHWGIVVIGALVGDGRQRRRVVAGAVATVWLYLHMPWWGTGMVQRGEGPAWWARLLENSFALFAVVALIALWWLVARGRGVVAASAVATGSHGAGPQDGGSGRPGSPDGAQAPAGDTGDAGADGADGSRGAGGSVDGTGHGGEPGPGESTPNPPLTLPAR